MNKSHGYLRDRIMAVLRATFSKAFSCWKCCIVIQISVPKSIIDNTLSLVEAMAWCRIGETPLPGPMGTQLSDAYMRPYGAANESMYILYNITVSPVTAQIFAIYSHEMTFNAALLVNNQQDLLNTIQEPRPIYKIFTNVHQYEIQDSLNMTTSWIHDTRTRTSDCRQCISTRKWVSVAVFLCYYVIRRIISWFYLHCSGHFATYAAFALLATNVWLKLFTTLYHFTFSSKINSMENIKNWVDTYISELLYHWRCYESAFSMMFAIHLKSFNGIDYSLQSISHPVI